MTGLALILFASGMAALGFCVGVLATITVLVRDAKAQHRWLDQ